MWNNENRLDVWILNVSHGRVTAKLEVEGEKVGEKCNSEEFWNMFIYKFVDISNLGW